MPSVMLTAARLMPTSSSSAKVCGLAGTTRTSARMAFEVLLLKAVIVRKCSALPPAIRVPDALSLRHDNCRRQYQCSEYERDAWGMQECTAKRGNNRHIERREHPSSIEIRGSHTFNGTIATCIIECDKFLPPCPWRGGCSPARKMGRGSK